MSTLTVHDETASGGKTHTFTLEWWEGKMSKAFLLAADASITGPGILGPIRQG